MLNTLSVIFITWNRTYFFSKHVSFRLLPLPYKPFISKPKNRYSIKRNQNAEGPVYPGGRRFWSMDVSASACDEGGKFIFFDLGQVCFILNNAALPIHKSNASDV